MSLVKECSSVSVELLIAGLLRVAREDLDGARLLAQATNRNAVYLCEQAAEKIIRAVLSSEGLHAGIKHHLDEMVDLVPDVNPIKGLLRKIEDLGAFATSYRYPTAAGRVVAPPTGPAIAKLISDVNIALERVSEAFAVDLSKPNSPASKPTPIR
jgi:HEPN domain-containing protein